MNAALVPVRSISGAKNRLASRLDEAQREQLALAMLEDMLAALGACPTLDRVVVVSADAGLLEEARRLGADTIAEERPCGLNGAVSMAARRLEAEGVRRLLTIPGDVPLLDPAEIEALFEISSDRYPVVLAPSASVTGTNGLLTSPPTVIEFRFEGRSLDAHRAACREAGVELLLLALDGFALDVDTPADLDCLRGRSGSRTATLVSGWSEDAARRRPA